MTAKFPTHDALVDEGYTYMARKANRTGVKEVRLYTRREEHGGRCGIMKLWHGRAFEWTTYETHGEAVRIFDETGGRRAAA